MKELHLAVSALGSGVHDTLSWLMGWTLGGE